MAKRCVETAADAYGDHRAAKAVTVAARAIRQALVKIDPTYSDDRSAPQ